MLHEETFTSFVQPLRIQVLFLKKKKKLVGKNFQVLI